ncbi:hypothetical protein Tco_1226840 [Tanacetum coccineum]
MGMDWLSKRKFVIVCHEKVVRIPLEGNEILRVHGERTQGAMKTLMNTKIDEPKLSHIFVSKEEHEVHLKLVLESLRKEKLYVKFSKLGDALSRKKGVKSGRVRGMILAAQSEAFKQENVLAERLHGLDQQMERKGDENANLHVPFDEIKVDKTLRFVEEPVEIMDREIKRLKRGRRITYGYPWPELEGKGFGLIQERLRSSAWCLSD